MKMLIILPLLMLSALVAESTVLDPALYLSPSPPLVLTSDSIPPEELWLQSLETRLERVAREVSKGTEAATVRPVETGRMFWPRFSAPQPALGINIPLSFSLSGSYGKPLSPTGVVGNTYTSVTGLGSTLGGSGSYGKLISPGVVGNTYSISGSSLGGLGTSLLSKTTVGSTASMYGSYGRSALAGSSYGTYGAPSVRVYGSDGAASWSGWGNGKWGHYGKG